MRKVFQCVALLSFFFIYSAGAYAQRTCGTEVLMQHLQDKLPNADAALKQTKAENLQYAHSYKSNLKTMEAAVTIPVVFHIVLNQTQITRLGGTSGIEQRIESQLAVVNRDFNKENADSTKIPAAFRPLYANANIRFALAHRKPDGSATPGYEILTTTAAGFEESGTTGSGMGFAEAKFLDGNITAWNPDIYLNIWVVAPLSNGSTGSILGLAVPPSFLRYNIPGFTKNEIGLVLNYGAFGARAKTSDYYISGINGGRTLTHELGHFFEIWHIWGDDGGLCANNGGDDDGIADTPPQADATYGCPTGTRYDACSATGDGIMYMNFMDYVNDACMHMFTHGQARVMQSTLLPGRGSYTLTQHPEVLHWPTDIASVQSAEADFNVYPNPASGQAFITGSKNLTAFSLYDMAGKLVKQAQLAGAGSNQHSIDLSGLPGGMYILHCNSNDTKVIKKLMVR